MGRKRHTPEQIIRKLREAEVELAKGQTTGEVVRKLGITEQTYYRWRKEYGGLRLDQAKRLKELEKENGRLKKLLELPGAGGPGQLMAESPRGLLLRSVVDLQCLLSDREGLG